MATYEYQPKTGVLSGDQFEAQTEAFLNDLDTRITEFLSDFTSTVTELRAAISRLNNEVTAIKLTLAETQSRVSSLEDRMTAVEKRCTALENRASEIEDNLPPDGTIVLTDLTSTPTGWKYCDGTSTSTDLSHFATLPLKYIRKEVG